MSEKTTFDEWALVELFGHNRIVGRVTEATLAGGSFIRVDVPQVHERQPFTRFFGPGAIYAINPVSEEVARQMLEHIQAEPVKSYEFPKLAVPGIPDNTDSDRNLDM